MSYMEISMFVYYLGGANTIDPQDPAADDSPVLEETSIVFDVFYLDNKFYDAGNVYSADRCHCKFKAQQPLSPDIELNDRETGQMIAERHLSPIRDVNGEVCVSLWARSNR